MESGRYDNLKRLMASIAGGDRMAAFALRVEFAPELRSAVRRAASSCGRTLPSEEVEAIATDFCTWLITHAAAWRPEGAKPWQWAWAHLTNEVRRNTGFWPLARVEPEEVPADEPLVAVADGEILDTFGRIAESHPRLGPVKHVLDATSTPADVALLLQYAEQAEAGDPSPSHTIAPQFGISPDAARKRVQRARERARLYIAAHPEHAALADLALFAADARSRQRSAA